MTMRVSGAAARPACAAAEQFSPEQVWTPAAGGDPHTAPTPKRIAEMGARKGLWTCDPETGGSRRWWTMEKWTAWIARHGAAEL